MENFKSRLSHGAIERKDWEQIYILTRHWESDLQFYLEDLQFLQRLISNYAIWIRTSENATVANDLLTEVSRLSEQGKTIKAKTRAHLEDLSTFLQAKTDGSPELLIEEHADLDTLISKFVKAFRTNRQKVYSVSERIMKDEDTSHPLKDQES